MHKEDYLALKQAVEDIGVISFSESGLVFCEGVLRGKMAPEEVFQHIERCWNLMSELIGDVDRMVEDHARMTDSLQRIDKETLDALRCTSRLMIPGDWWIVRD